MAGLFNTGGWDQAKFDAAQALKYRILQQQANAQSAEAAARAKLMAEDAKTKVPLANSAIRVDSANSAYTGMKTVEEPKNNAVDRAYNIALTDKVRKDIQWYDDKARADIGATNAGARQADATAYAQVMPARPLGSSYQPGESAAARIVNSLGVSPPSSMGGMMPPVASGGVSLIQGDAAPSSPMGLLTAPSQPTTAPRRGSSAQPLSLTDFTSIRSSLFKDDEKSSLGLGYKFKRGTARVPGKGEGDIKPAMLEPGEAVLNKHAAGMMGRDKIAKLNAKGNEKRAKVEGQRVSKLAQALKQMGMV